MGGKSGGFMGFETWSHYVPSLCNLKLAIMAQVGLELVMILLSDSWVLGLQEWTSMPSMEEENFPWRRERC